MAGHGALPGNQPISLTSVNKTRDTAVLATVAAARTARAGGDIVAGYRLSFLVGAGMGVLAMALAAAQVRSRIRQREPEELAAAAEPARE